MGRRQYTSHRLYCEAPVTNLEVLVAEYLTDRFYVSSSDPDRDYELFGMDHLRSERVLRNSGDKQNKIWPSMWMQVYPSRVDGDSGVSVGVRIVDLQWAEQTGLLRADEMPVHIRSRFRVCPNYIEFDSHYRCSWAAFAVCRGVQPLVSERYNTFVHKFDEAYLDLIQTSFSSDAERDVVLVELVTETFNPTGSLVWPDQDLLPLTFSRVVPRLSRKSLQTLVTAESIAFSQLPILDWSPVVICYCKAVEIELLEKLLQPIQKAALHRRDQKSWSPTKDKRITRLYDYALKDSGRPLELGTLANALEHVLNAEPYSDPVKDLVLEHLRRFGEPDWATGPFISELRHLVRNYRNAAAHTTILAKEDAAECRQLVLGSASHRGILARLLSSST